MSVLIYNLVTAGMLILVVKAAQRLAPRRRFPVVAVVLTTLIIGGLILQAVWSGAMDALDSDPSRSGWWRLFTSVLMQSGGFFGDLWNVVTIAVVAALAEWHWGRLTAAGLFLAGALLPYGIGVLFGAEQGSTDPRNWAGSSGATYFLGATLAGALLVRALRARNIKELLLAVSAPVIGVTAWFAQENAHGVVVAEGFVLGVLVALVLRALGLRALDGRGDEAGSSPRVPQERCVSRS